MQLQSIKDPTELLLVDDHNTVKPRYLEVEGTGLKVRDSRT